MYRVLLVSLVSAVKKAGRAQRTAVRRAWRAQRIAREVTQGSAPPARGPASPPSLSLRRSGGEALLAVVMPPTSLSSGMRTL